MAQKTPSWRFHLFTLHKDEEDFQIIASVIAEAPEQAATFWGGLRERGTTTVGLDRYDLTGVCIAAAGKGERVGLAGSVIFVSTLFKPATAYQIKNLGYDPGSIYEAPGLKLYAEKDKSVKLVLRRQPIYIPDEIIPGLVYEKQERADMAARPA